MARQGLTKRALTGIGWLALTLAALIFGPAWSLTYWQGWILWFLFTASCLAITLHLLRHDPALVERRMKSGPTAEREPSQKIIQAFASVLFCAIIVVPSFDHRFGWSAVLFALIIVGDCLVVLGFWIVFIVFRENSFASSIIEVSADQKVVSTGPYAWVRHPMYAGALLLLAGIPIALGSWWGLAPVALICGALVWRLLDEERYLARHLAGYEAYQRQVRWRLAPGLW
jgi:protein-S-isoprenylcysteine O-methyltransferase Ste14